MSSQQAVALPGREWEADARRRAHSLYRTEGARLLAATIACSHPYAIQYLEQAPALLVYACWGCTEYRPHQRAMIAGQFRRAIGRGAKLRDVMAAFQAPYPIRRLSRSVCLPSYHREILGLRRIPPSPLAQAIPEKPAQQRQWLHALRATFARERLHCPAGAPEIVVWMATNASRFICGFEKSSDAAEAVAHSVPPLCDFLFREPHRFNPRWTFERAYFAMEEWHTELRGRAALDRLSHDYGVDRNHRFNYAPFPDRCEVDGFQFVALRSGNELWEEGRTMHHCVASYVGLVARGETYIFSIRQDGRRVATMEVRAAQGRWFSIAQLRGPANALVRGPIKDAAERFIVRAAGYMMTVPEL